MVIFRIFINILFRKLGTNNDITDLSNLLYLQSCSLPQNSPVHIARMQTRYLAVLLLWNTLGPALNRHEGWNWPIESVESGLTRTN